MPVRFWIAICAIGASLTLTRAADEPEKKKSPKELAALNYRLVGPYAGGRVSRVSGVPNDPLTYYAAAASGGVWKSSDAGITWKPIFDDQPTASIGSIAVAPSDPNVVYVGTGEANIRGNVSPGAGIFKSTDGGKTWQHVWKQIGQIGTMVVHPKQADIAYAAVLGHAFGPNAERGIYRTTDGGQTWAKVLFQNDATGASDVAIDPSNPRVVFAGFWQAQRRPWELTSGGPGSDLSVSRDGGDTWVSLKSKRDKNGLPPGLWGKIGVAVSPSNGNRIYASIEAEKGGLYRSDDGGENWSLINGERIVRQRAWYYSTIVVHPTNPDVLYMPQVPLLKSIDGGKSFQIVKGLHHGDHHDLWIDPTNPNRMIDANDGGVDLSSDGGKTWHAPPLPLAQFYHVSADNRTPYRIMGCMQDLGSASGPSHSLKPGGIGLGDWTTVGGGEAGHCIADPTDPDIVYAGEYGGILTRFDFRTKQARNITVNQVNPSGIDPSKMKYRFQWTAPILISPHDAKTLYHAGNVLFRTRDGGTTWEAVSPDLSRNDKQKQQWSGGPITGDNTGAETYCTIFALAESPKQKGLLWAGTDDGKVHVSTDDAKTWTDLTANVPDLPDWGTVVCIEASPFDAKTAYLVVDNHRMDDYRPYIWKTTDLGKTWTKIGGGLDAGTHLHAVREDPKKAGWLYLGTECGILFSNDAGKNWKPLQLNLPTVAVHDLVVKNDDLLVATHGRSLWILDDLTAIRNYATSTNAKPLHVFAPLPATKWYLGGRAITSHLRGSSTSNPDNGAVIWFHAPKPTKDGILVEIRDAKGTLVAKAKGKLDAKSDDEYDEDAEPKAERTFAVKPGLNKFVWDFTHDGAEFIPKAKVDAGNPAMGIPASPGNYTIKLMHGKEIATTTLEVKADPRGDAKPAIEQELFALGIRDGVTKLTRTVLRIRTLQKQIRFRKELLKDRDDAKPLLKDSETLSAKLTTLEEKLHNPKAKVVYDVFAARGGAMLYSQFVWLLGNATDGDGTPTKAQKELAVELEKTLAAYIAELDAIAAKDLVPLNDAAKKLGVPELYVAPVKPVAK